MTTVLGPIISQNLPQITRCWFNFLSSDLSLPGLWQREPPPVSCRGQHWQVAALIPASKNSGWIGISNCWGTTRWINEPPAEISRRWTFWKDTIQTEESWRLHIPSTTFGHWHLPGEHAAMTQPVVWCRMMSVFIILTLGKTPKKKSGAEISRISKNTPALHSPWLMGCSSSKNQIGTRATAGKHCWNVDENSLVFDSRHWTQILICAFLCTLHACIKWLFLYIIHPNTFKYCIWIVCNNPKADSKLCLMGASNVNHIHDKIVWGHCVLHIPMYATCVGSKTGMPPAKLVVFVLNQQMSHVDST